MGEVHFGAGVEGVADGEEALFGAVGAVGVLGGKDVVGLLADGDRFARVADLRLGRSSMRCTTSPTSSSIP